MHPWAVALGGAVGTLVRMLLTQGGQTDGWDPRISVVNVLGALALGVLVRLPLRSRTRDLLASGGLGSLTSFSALTLVLVDTTPAYAVALGLVASLLGGVAAAALGYWLGGLLVADAADEADEDAS